MKFKYLFYSAIFSLLFLSLWQAFSPFIFHGQEISEVRQKVRFLRGEDVAAVLTSKEQKPTLLYMYAGWCTPCHEMGPKLLAMQQKGMFEGMNVLFISLDEEVVDFARYFVMNGYYPAIAPYLLHKQHAAGFMKVMKLTGANFNGGIPYVAVFDAQGKMVSEAIGGVKDDVQMATMLAQLRRSSPMPY